MATPLIRDAQHVDIQTRQTTLVRQNGNQKNSAVVEHDTQLPAVGSDIDIVYCSAPQLIYRFGYAAQVLD